MISGFVMERIQIGAIQINNVNLSSALEFVSGLVENKKSKNNYICLPDGYVLALANKDQKLQSILNKSTGTFPDGKILEKVARLKGFDSVSTVSGYNLLEHFIEKPNISHYFYGGSEESIEALASEIKRKHKNPNVLGYKSPPFLNLDEIDNNQLIRKDIEDIKTLSPDIMWVGISSPKQDYLMANFAHFLPNTLLIGVGAVFDYYSGRVKKSPDWVKKMGLRWLYRFVREPKRMYKKEFRTIGFGIPFYLSQIIQNRKSTNSNKNNIAPDKSNDQNKAKLK